MKYSINSLQTSFSYVHKPLNWLNRRDLMDLIEGRRLYLRISPFVHESDCWKWTTPLEISGQLSRYSNAQDVSVNRIGMTLFETENKPKKLEEYFQTASNTFSMIEEILGEDENPIRSIHEELNRIWNQGCHVETLKGQMMTPGIIRSFEADEQGGLPPHNDMLCKDIPMSSEFDSMKMQLAANLYLRLPEEGGELEIWDYEPTPNEMKELLTGDYDFVDRNKIPFKPIVIKPRMGELILFRSTCIHSVRPSRRGMRTAASCFVGYYSEDEPLTVWA